VEVAERHADGLASESEMAQARETARRVMQDLYAGGIYNPTGDHAASSAVDAALWKEDPKGEALLKTLDKAANAAVEALDPAWSMDDLNAEGEAQNELCRDLAGDLSRSVVLEPVWLPAHVRQLARTAYEERILPRGELDTARLAVLADALEEAGCTEPALLDHLRGPGRHVRGCFGVDLILSKDR
jgi:hypothetical protein